MQASYRTVALFLLFFLSGAAALIYELLWLKELGRLFGVTSYAAATTLAAFFLGICSGSWVWGERIKDRALALRTYARLEFGIALSALFYFLLYDLYARFYPLLAGALHGSGVGLLSLKFVLSVLVLTPPAFFMGGTLPVMGHYVVRRQSELGSRVSLLYLVNTLGAALGVILAGFVLPPQFGFRKTYFVAIAMSLFVSVLAYLMSHREATPPPQPPTLTNIPFTPPSHSFAKRELLTLAAFSGCLTLSLEVLWTRMFEQVLQNSVYTFAAVLTVFLIALSMGSALANRLCKWPLRTERVVLHLLVTSAVLIALTPHLFYRITNGLHEIGAGASWATYVLQVFLNVALIILLPTFAIGTLFPYLMKLGEGIEEKPGAVIGRLAGINNLAAIIGSLAAGFVLLPFLGLWRSIYLLSIIYALLAVGSAMLACRKSVVIALAGLGAVIALGLSGKFQSAAVDAAKGERLVATYEGSHGTVTVIERGSDLRLKENNGHLVGTSQSAPNLRMQSWIPLCVHPQPRTVFYLGMGTGITAGGALDFPVENVVVTELSPLILRADKEWFAPFSNQLFSDRRVRIVQDDGRNHLLANRESYDLIIADIFLTHHAGIANLYSLEHYQTVKNRLRAGGVFCQWLPMFEMSEEEFWIVARTMLDVFPQVTLWRRGFSPSFPVYGLMASTEPEPLDPAAFVRNVAVLDSAVSLDQRIWFQQIPYAAYVCDLSSMRGQLGVYPLNTDDWPVIEYVAPRVERDRFSGSGEIVLAWETLGEFVDDLATRCPLEQDRFLSGLPAASLDQVRAGRAYYHFTVSSEMQKPDAARWLAEYESLLGGDSIGAK